MGGAVVAGGLVIENRYFLAPAPWQLSFHSIVRKCQDRLGSSMNTQTVLTAP